MRNMLALLGAAVVVFALVGWFLGWYQLGTESTSAGHHKINVDLNTNKIAVDLKKGKEKVGEILSSDHKGTSTVPQAEKKVDGQPSGLKINPDGVAEIILPPLSIKTGD